MRLRFNSILLSLLLPLAALAGGPSPSRLRCEYLVDPIGLQEARPRLSWIVTSERRGERQTAYQILVASTLAGLAKGQGDVWSSGKVASPENNQVVYGGPALGSRQICHWKVRVADRDGAFGPWSPPATWEMGLLTRDAWRAQWLESRLPEPEAVPMFRKTLELPSKAILRARVYATALGLYELRLNGHRVGDHVLAPEWTDYRRRVRCQVYDVTSMVHQGRNALGALLAPGWYSGTLGNGAHRFFGTTPALFAQLEVTYRDGTTACVATDGTWKTQASPITASDFMKGEAYDARKECPGWDQPTLDDAAWAPATPRNQAPIAMDAQVMEPVRALLELKPRTLTQNQPGRWIYDLGQNMVGVVRLRVTAPAGTCVTLRHAEMLDPAGALYVENLRGAPSIDHYICKGGGPETWQPRFTFHGFRYVELSGLPSAPDLAAVTGIVLGSDTATTGTFSCSDPRLNQLQANIRWGQRGNYLSVPTDCPQRDERLGWMGDAQVFVRTATCNADVAAFFTKWLVDVTDGQAPDGAFKDVNPDTMNWGGVPGWGDAGVICPWTIHQAYGDTRILERNLPAMRAWIAWMKAHSTGLIRDKDRGHDYGDWLSIDADTPKDLIGTAFFAHATDLVARSCQALGLDAEARDYARLFQDIRAAFQRRYLTPDGHLQGDTQCAYAMALTFDLLPDPLRPEAARILEENIRAHGDHLTTGFLGVGYLLPALTQAGRVDAAYRLLTQDTFPSWLFSVKHGATTIWERWDGWTPEKGFQDPGMNSFNHYSLPTCGQWLFETVAGLGLDPQVPAYRHILLHPRPGGGLTSAQASLDTVRGTVASSWHLAGGVFTLQCRIPVGATATLVLPATSPACVTEGGLDLAKAPGLELKGRTPGEITLELGSGTYAFTCREP